MGVGHGGWASGLLSHPPGKLVRMSVDGEVARVASRQHALVTRSQLLEMGIGDGTLRHRVRVGRLTAVRRDVFAIPGAGTTREQVLLAAVLAHGSGAVLSHASAAALWRLPNIDHEGIEVTSARPHRVRLTGVTAHRTVAFLAEEHTVRDAIPVTTVARTIVDLSARLSTFQLGVMTDHALRHNTLTLTQLRRCVGGLHPGPGRRTSCIHELLEARGHGHDPGDSDLELRVLRAIVAAGLPEPVQQHWVRLPKRRFRLDLAYPEPIKLAIEVDGFGPHATRTAFDADRARANDLVVAGWTVVRFTSASSDDDVAATVAAALAQLGHKAAS